MRPYEHGGDIYGGARPLVDFSVNVNPLGMPPAALDALGARPEEDVRYPDPSCRALRHALSQRFGVTPDSVLCGCGSADLILRVCLALRPKMTLVTAPAFSEYARSASLAGSAVKEFPLREETGFAVTADYAGAVTADTDLVFLCNPNNPTGRLCDSGAVEALAVACRKKGAVLVVDECFLPFTEGTSALPLLQKYPNVLILRAFTKIYAMAGLRLGVLLGDAELLSRIEPYGAQWSVSTVAQRAGLAALSQTEWAEDSRRYTAAQRQRLAERFTALGLTVYPSDSNFLLLRSPMPLPEKLRERGLWVRKCENFTGLDNTYFRVGVQRAEENELLLRAVEEIVHG